MQPHPDEWIGLCILLPQPPPPGQEEKRLESFKVL
jgi:hypothetical protein